MTRPKESSGVARYQFVLLLAIYLLSASLRIDSGDGETMYQVTRSLIRGKGLAIPVASEILEGGHTGYGKVGIGGLYYSKYGLGWSLAAVPFCALGRLTAALWPGVTDGLAARAAVMLLNPLVTAVAVILLLCIASRLYRLPTAAKLSLLYGLCTVAWYYAKSAFSEPMVTLLLLGALNAVERRNRFAAGMMLGGMILVRQTAALLAIPVTGWALTREQGQDPQHSPRSLAPLLLPMALGQLAALSYNAYRFGNPLDFGYSGATWGTPVLQGLRNQLISPGKGLFVFMPVLLLGLAGWPALLQRRRDWAWLTLVTTAVYLLPHAVYGEWTGGGGWGPRLLLPIVPFLVLPIGETIERWQTRPIGRLLLVLLAALSLLIQVLGVSVNWARHLQRMQEISTTHTEYFQRVHYRWIDSPIPGQIRSLQSTLRLVTSAETRRSLHALVSPEVAKPLRDWQSEAVGLLSFNVPDFWFVYLWFLGVPSHWLIMILLILVAAAVWAVSHLRPALI